MTTILVLVESPGKCKKIEEYLGKEYKCLATCGHLREIKNGLDDLAAETYEPLFSPCAEEDKRNLIEKIRQAILVATEVILATDADREGEAIAWHLTQLFNLPLATTKRILFHEITPTALQEALRQPTVVNMALVQAQITRQVLDLLVGYRISPTLWKYVKTGLSAGRCQTPALRLVYEQHMASEASKPTSVNKVTGYFTSLNLPFVLEVEEEASFNKEVFFDASKTHEHVYLGFTTKLCVRPPPMPFTTCTLQQAAHNEMHISPKETMTLCQKLYESGYITYMRTDSTSLSRDFLKKLYKFIAMEYPNVACDACDAAALAVAAHEAIRPTDVKIIKIPDLSSKENKMYTLIRNQTLASVLPSAKINILCAHISSPSAAYVYTTEQVVSPGWQMVYKKDKKDKDQDKEYHFLQTLKVTSVLPYKKITCQQVMQGGKLHYTEAKLIQLLEKHGIGRPSTYAALVEKIQERGYVRKENVPGILYQSEELVLQNNILKKTIEERMYGEEKNKLVITTTGLLTIEFLLLHYEPLFNYAYTRQMEESLQNKTTTTFEECVSCDATINALSHSSNFLDGKGIYLDENHTYMLAKYGPVVRTVTSDITKTVTSDITKKTKKKKVTYKAARDDLDLTRLKQGGYTMEEILQPADFIDGKQVYIKKSKFGHYVECDGVTMSLKKNEEPSLEALTKKMQEAKTNGVRVITPEAEIRKGPYGDYIFYHTTNKTTKKKSKPIFLKLDDCPLDYQTCALDKLKTWFEERYNL